MQATPEQIQAAWKKAGELAQHALEALQSVNQGPIKQAQLMWIVEKAPVQIKLNEDPNKGR